MPSHSPFLFPPCDDQNAPFALRPLLIAGMVQPIVEGDGGINIAVVSDHAEGLLCLINSYLGMRAGDSHDIFWETKVIFRRTVEPGDVDKPMYFFLPVDGLASGWVEQCYYQLTRAGATVPDDPSVPLRLLVKLFRPGGRDREPHLPDGHSELKIVQLPPDLVDQGVIDAAWAEKGVPVTIPFYPDMTLRDSILLRWGSVALTPYRVTQAHVDRLQPIVIVVDQEAILAGGDGKKLEIKYDLYDETWNWAVRHSKRTHIDVDAGAWRLDAPIIKEAINGTITVKDLNKQPVTVQVRVAGTDFALGDTLTMTWIGTPFTGQPLIHSESRTIESVPGTVEINVPYEDVRAIAMGRADASYVLRKNSGGPPLSSKRTFADVVGAVVMLPEPTIRELIGDTLEPDTPLATVDVRYPGMANGDLINLIWLGTQADGVPYPHEEQHTVTRNEAEAKLITFQIKNQHIKVLDGGSLDLSYRVSNDNVTLYGVSESDRLLAKVQVIHATLPAPQVPEATNGVLDPDNVSDNVTVLVNFPGTHKDDILTYYWTGPGASTSDWVPITSLIIGKPVRFRLDARYVHANTGQSIKVRYSLLRAATNQFEYSAGLDLLIGEQVGVLPAPTVIQAADGTLNPMDALKGVDINVSYPDMKPDQDIIRLKWLGTPGAGTSDDLELPGDASGSVAFHLPPTVVAANLSKRVEVEYEVKRHSRPTPSQTLDLLVSGFQNPETELPRPLVVQATGNVLDLTTFTGDATTRVSVWPLIALKQRVWLALEGQTSTGTDHRVILLDGVEMSDAQVGNGLNAGLLRSELVKLGHATSAKVICKVAFDGGTVESAAIVFPVLELTVRTRYDYVTPTITEVSDSQGQVPEGGTTFDKQVTVKGTATRGENVALFDGTTPLGTADVTDSGIWSKVLSGLAVKSYQIIASALYDSDPVASKPRGFSVAQAVAPTIANVTDSKGTVAHGGTTFDHSVTVTGKASPNQKVRLRDGSTSLGEPTANASGDWSQVVTGLTIKGYSLTALALYGDGAVSPERTFTVTAALHDCTDFTLGNFNGWQTVPAGANILRIEGDNYLIRMPRLIPEVRKTFTLQAGQYQFTLRARSDDSRAILQIMFQDRNIWDLTTTWANYHASLTLTGTRNVTIQLANAGSEGTYIDFDDLCVKLMT
jgi:hypothetical protein